MLYVPFLAEKMVKKIHNKRTINVLQGGGQRSMVKDHKMTIFFGTLPLVNKNAFFGHYKYFIKN